jgi:branched-subunit amino acid aminotransferase/4-amino-4-deoxychorismate lyase
MVSESARIRRGRVECGLSETRIPFIDQGFLHGDLTYDVPSVWDRRFFRLDDHLTRLEASCQKIRMTLPLPRDEIKRILVDMVAKSGIRDAFVEYFSYLTICFNLHSGHDSAPFALR